LVFGSWNLGFGSFRLRSPHKLSRLKNPC
jgi:hypothetical protein